MTASEMLTDVVNIMDKYSIVEFHPLVEDFKDKYSTYVYNPYHKLKDQFFKRLCESYNTLKSFSANIYV